MKRFLIKACVFVITFTCAILIISKIMNRDNNSTTREMAKASLPIVQMRSGELLYNELHGIVGQVDVVYQRDTFTVLGEERGLDFQVQLYDTKIKRLGIEVRSCDGSRLIEQTEITEYEKVKDTLQIQTVVKDLIEPDTEYALIVVITDENDREIRYYTRMIWSESLYATPKLAFVKEFHETTFQKENLSSLAKYMESNSKGNNTTLHKVDIHSSLAQLGWGELEVTPESDVVLNLKDISGQTASIELQRMVSSGKGKNKNYYFVEEQYRIRYTVDRVYLLDFDRTMTQIPDVEGDIYGNNKIMLGIVSEETPLVESTDGNIVVFQAANRLCSYNITTNKLALLFSFYDEDHMDSRSTHMEHAIEILDVDEGGNVQFVVYGYMNRGRHEGEIGIQLYAYDSDKNTIEESVYIPCEKSFDILDCEIQNLLYWNREGIFYLYLNNAIYAVDTVEKQVEKLAVMENDDAVEISDNHQVAVWHQGEDLCLMNLSRQSKVIIQNEEGEQLYPLGFMDEDLIYGVAKKADIALDATGKYIVPMYKVNICDFNGKLLKEYEQENIYITDCEIEGNQITLSRIQRKENGDYKEIEAEHIMNNEEAVVGKNKLTIAAIDIYERIVQVEVRNTIDEKSIQILTPKEVVFEGARSTTLELEKQEQLYYVYDRYGVAGVYQNPATALELAYERAGTVMDMSGRTVWIKGNRATRNQIMAIKEQESSGGRSDIAVCLEVMLQYEGISANIEKLLEEGETVITILQKYLEDKQVVDLTGCNLDTVLDFVNKDVPVLAVLEDGEAVLIVGFNQYNIVILEPDTGKLVKKGINDSTEWFEKNGNRFITYIE